jgi:hypothetical protein
MTADLRVRRGRGELRLTGDGRTLWVEPVGWRGLILAIRSAWELRRAASFARRAAEISTVGLGLRVAGLSVPLLRPAR